MAKETETVKGDVDKDPVIQEIRNSLTNEAERVSSASSGIEDTISDAISSRAERGESSASRIESSFDRQRTEATMGAQSNINAFASAQGGFATNMVALRGLVHETDVYLKDLEGRREEALMANNELTAQAIDELILKSEEMKMNAFQQTFENLVAVGSMNMQARQFELGQSQSKEQFELTYELNGKQFQLQKDQQSFQEKQAMAGVALEYGLDVSPTDTIDSIINKAAATGIVDTKRALELESMRASISASNAQAASAMRANKITKVDELTADVLARGYREGRTEFMKGLDQEGLQVVLGRVQEIEDYDRETIKALAESSDTQEAFLKNVAKVAVNLSENEALLLNNYAARVATEVTFKPTPKGQVTSIGSLIKGREGDPKSGVVGAWSKMSAHVYEFFSGEDVEGWGQELN